MGVHLPRFGQRVAQHEMALHHVAGLNSTLSKADLPIAPSTFYAARTRPPSARAVRDEDLKAVIVRVHQENYGVYGIRKMHAQLNREELFAGCRSVARCTTQRLMKDLGLRGISRAKGPRTTVPGTGPDTRPDLVERAFTADGPNRLWVADFERHEALLNRVEVGDLDGYVVVAPWCS